MFTYVVFIVHKKKNGEQKNTLFAFKFFIICNVKSETVLQLLSKTLFLFGIHSKTANLLEIEYKVGIFHEVIFFDECLMG